MTVRPRRSTVFPVIAKRFSDVWPAAFLLVFLWTEIAFFWVPSEAGPRGAAIVFGTPMCVALLWRRRAPLATAAAVAGLLMVWSAFGPPAGTLGAWLVGLVAIYSVAQERELWRAILGAALVLASEEILVGFAPEVGFGDYAFVTVFGLCAWAAGRAMLARHRRGEELAALSAREAVAEERLRIARELHDVVAHNVGVIVVQAQAAGGLIDGAPDDAAQAVRAIEQTGRQALTEMRRLVGLMRAEPAAPLPSLAQLDSLADDLRSAGMAVTVAVSGEPVSLPPSVDASGYRIVQEGLTNVLKHAPGARAEVVVAYLAGALELSVTDDGQGGDRGNGYGLAGIRERVAVFGGELEAGPGPGGGWRLCARLPLA
jgi:signal transduction histidine kinase